MRLTLPLSLAAALLAGSVQAQQSGQSSVGGVASTGTMPLSPNNCGTPDEPKACPGTRGASHHPTRHPAQYHHPEPRGH